MEDFKKKELKDLEFLGSRVPNVLLCKVHGLKGSSTAKPWVLTVDVPVIKCCWDHISVK